MIQHGSPISGVDASEDGLILTAGYDNRLILWHAAQHRALARGCHDHLVNQCAISPCGKFAASSSSDYSARLWRLPELRLQAVMTGHTDDVEGIAFHPARPALATGSRDAAIRLFDFSGRLLRTMRGHRADVLSVAWQEGGAVLVSSSDDGTIKRWDAEQGTLIEDIDLGDIETDTIAVGPGVVFAGNDEGEIVVITGAARRRVPAHAAGIKRLIWNGRQNILLSLSYDRTFKLWQWRDGKLDCRHSAGLPLIVWPRSAAFLNEKRLVFGTFGSACAVYDIESSAWELDHITDTNGFNAVRELNGALYAVGDSGVVRRDGAPHIRLPGLCNFLSPYAGTLVTGGQSGEVLDALTGRGLYRHRSPLNCATTFPCGGEPKLLIGTYTGEGLVFGTGPGGTIVFERTVSMHCNAVKGVAASAGAIFSVCADGAAAFHCPKTLERRAYVPHAHDKIANGCAALPDGRFASVSRDLKLRLWNGEAAKVMETPSRNSIKCVAVSADGALAAIGNYTGHVGVCRLADGEWLGWQQVSASGISSLSASADGRFLFSAYDGTAFFLEPEPWSLSVSGGHRAGPGANSGPAKNGHYDEVPVEEHGIGPSASVPDRHHRWRGAV